MWLRRTITWGGMNGEHLAYVASAALLLVFYAIQPGILRYARTDRVAAWVYFGAIVLSLPYCWGVSPYWNNPQCFTTATIIGWPVMIHAMPLIAFRFGLRLRRDGRLGDWWLTALLTLLAVPLWHVVWECVQLFCCGFIWI